MTKAIATAPNLPTDYVELTAQEQAHRAAEEAQLLANKPMRDWQAEMGRFEKELPKHIENIIEAQDAPTRARIPIETLSVYNAKKAHRSKPV